MMGIKRICNGILPVAIASFIIMVFLAGCHNKSINHPSMKAADTVAGTFGYDLDFIQKYQETVLLSDSVHQAQVMIIPGWQGRVMTSTAGGKAGFSYGWINYKLIASGQKAPHMNAYGGEERLWLGPEGGPFSIYFSKGSEQVFNNWFVPAELDTVAFETVSKNQSGAIFRKQFSLENYAGSRLDIGIERKITLLDNNQISRYLEIDLPDSVHPVAYQSENILKNLGRQAWTKETGMLSIWMLSMLTPSQGVTIFIPLRKPGSKPVVHDDYFGKVPADRLITDNNMVYLKADGKYRSKIGIPPRFAGKFAASYDAVHHTLTVLECEQPKESMPYVNSKWGKQDDPFSGDALNAYNDGPVEDGTQMGPFYELESSSPAASLKPGESITHVQRIYHFEGSEKELNTITEELFSVKLLEIKSRF